MATTPAPAPDLTVPQHHDRVGAAVDAALDALREIGWNAYVMPPRRVPEIEALHRLSPDLQRSVVIDLVARLAGGNRLGALLGGLRSGPSDRERLQRILGSFQPKRIPFTSGDAAILLELSDRILRTRSEDDLQTLPATIAAAERAVERDGPGSMSVPIERLAAALEGHRWSASKAAKYRTRLIAILSASGRGLDPHMITDGDTWGQRWQPRLKAMPASLHPLLVHVSEVTSVEPTQAWKARARELTSDPAARDLLRLLLEDVEATRVTSVPWALRGFVREPDDVQVPAFQDRNVLVLRGILWAAAMSRAEWAPDRLGSIGLICGTWVTGNSAREERLANAAAAALGSMDSEAAAAALGRMKARITNRNVSKQIAKALEAAATRRGTSASELLELAVPTLGLDADGRREEPVGDVVAVLAIEDDGAPTLSWREADGTVRANPPKRIVDGYPADVRRLKEAAKDLKKAFAVERGRVEDLFVEDREWDVPTWQTRYLEHPVTGSFGRRLIWRVIAEGQDVATVIPDGNDVRDAAGTAVALASDARIRLWHPIDAAEADIAAWRSAVMERRLRQPFKQAFREVYALTPAEEETETYSNRFAAHILLYAQARALMTARRWGSNFLGPFDGGYEGIAKRDFPSHGLRAEFYHDAIDDEANGGDVIHCSTDQVRFIRIARGGRAVDGHPVPLREVPPIVFSEAMRDVDLFVGVSSVGADRNWQDAGQGRADRYARLDQYFESRWDESLSATAQVRRDAIARILPGLAIADRLELLDRWLRVRGDLRAYRIHLGSGNILMEPHDAYLCIVPGRGQGAQGRIFLPFDDDPTLSLILSKAFLLAADTKITDRSITAQIKRG